MYECGFARKTTYYVRVWICAQGELCVRVQICEESELLCTCTALRIKQLMRTRYGFARKATYSSSYFLTRRRGDDSRADDRCSSDVVMTADGVLDDCVTVLIRCP